MSAFATPEMTTRHNVFVSFQHLYDQSFKEKFVEMMEGHIINRSVDDGDIDDNLSTDSIRTKIRDEFIRTATVTVVLVGKCTWQRKHVDWEIGSSLRATKLNPRCGLLGILLPSHQNYSNYYNPHYNPQLLPPRLADNLNGDNSYAKLYNWTENRYSIYEWIHTAFERRDGNPPINGREQFKYNKSGDCERGWS